MRSVNRMYEDTPSEAKRWMRVNGGRCPSEVFSGSVKRSPTNRASTLAKDIRDRPYVSVRLPLFRTLSSRRFRSEEHTSELQSQSNLVCRLLLEKKKN